MAKAKKSKFVSFEGWKKCVSIESGDFKLIVTTEVGPRIIGGFIGKNPMNIFHVDPKLAGKTGGDKWVNYGGHRLWHAPEDRERTYVPDNGPVEYEYDEQHNIHSFSVGEPSTGLEKYIIISPLGDGCFQVDHLIVNNNPWPVQFAPWALSVMAQGGKAYVDLDPAEKGLLPTKFISLWPYTDLYDKRLHIGKKALTVQQDPSPDAKPFKIGVKADSSILYVNGKTAFVKAGLMENPDEVYPDNNCNIEIYTCKDFLEAESIGPLRLIQPGGHAELREIWIGSAVKGVIKSEKDIQSFKKKNGLCIEDILDDEDDCGCGCGEHEHHCDCGCED